jgi:hypothetical protein
MADDVQLTDLEVIQRYSLAVRGATASRDELVAALQADLDWLRGGRRAAAKGAPAKIAASAPEKAAPSAPIKAAPSAPGKVATAKAAPSRAVPSRAVPTRAAPAQAAGRSSTTAKRPAKRAGRG